MKLNEYDDLIKKYADKYNLDWKLIKKQIIIESYYNPEAKSSIGAKGLMQFTDAAWSDFGEGDIFNPSDNIKAGCKYMKWLYEKFAEIPDETEQYKFALAAYNAGRRNINKMLELARKSVDQPASYREWKEAGKPSGKWQQWDYAKQFLCEITGHHSKETIDYVERVMNNFL